MINGCVPLLHPKLYGVGTFLHRWCNLWLNTEQVWMAVVNLNALNSSWHPEHITFFKARKVSAPGCTELPDRYSYRVSLGSYGIWRATSPLSEIPPKGGKGGFDVSTNGSTCTPVSYIIFLFRSVWLPSMSITGKFAAMILRTSRQWTVLEALVGVERCRRHSIHQESSRMP